MNCVMDHIVLNVENEDAMLAFYQEILTLPFTQTSSDSEICPHCGVNGLIINEQAAPPPVMVHHFHPNFYRIDRLFLEPVGLSSWSAAKWGGGQPRGPRSRASQTRVYKLKIHEPPRLQKMR